MLAVSSWPLPRGLTVLQTVARFGMPPTDSSPAFCQFADASRSGGSRPLAPPPPPPPEALSSGALHDAVVPPFWPKQLHSHGPVPLTPEAMPELHRPVFGALLTATLSAGPQTPLIACGLACAGSGDKAAPKAIEKPAKLVKAYLFILCPQQSGSRAALPEPGYRCVEVADVDSADRVVASSRDRRPVIAAGNEKAQSIGIIGYRDNSIACKAGRQLSQVFGRSATLLH